MNEIYKKKKKSSIPIQNFLYELYEIFLSPFLRPKQFLYKKRCYIFEGTVWPMVTCWPHCTAVISFVICWTSVNINRIKCQAIWYNYSDIQQRLFILLVCTCDEVRPVLVVKFPEYTPHPLGFGEIWGLVLLGGVR